MGNYSRLEYADIKARLTPAAVRGIIEGLGYRFDRYGKFALRDERTPSAAIDPKTGRITDFGGDFSGDIFDLLQAFHGMGAKEAKAHVARFVGLDESLAPDLSPSLSPQAKQAEPKRPQKEPDDYRVIRAAKMEFDGFAAIDHKHPAHLEEIAAVVPLWAYYQAHNADRALFHHLARYDRYRATLAVACYANKKVEMRFIGYKWRRYHTQDGKTIKWMARKGTRPNKEAFIRIYTDDRPVFVVEGHHDMLTAILLGMDFVMLPTASFRGDIGGILEETRGRRVIFLVEDEAAYKAMRPLAEELDAYDPNREIVLTQLERGDKCDLSDFIARFKDIQEAKLWLSRM